MKGGETLVEKMKEVLKHFGIGFFFAMMGFFVILLLTGAFRFAVAFIENRNPDFFEWLGMIFVCLVSGCAGLAWFIVDAET